MGIVIFKCNLKEEKTMKYMRWDKGEMVVTNKNLYVRFFFIFFIINNIALSFCCTRSGRDSLAKMINDNEIIRIYSTMDNYKTALYASDNLIESGVPEDDSPAVKQWQLFVACANELVLKAIQNKEAPVNYSKYVADLKKVDLFLLANIRDLHAKKRDSVEKKRELPKLYLTNVKKRVEANIEKVEKIFNDVFFTIILAAEHSAVWQKQAATAIEKDFSNYQIVFKTYDDWKKSEIEHAMKIGKDFYLTPEKIIAFLKYANIFQISKSGTGAKDKEMILFDKLEKITFNLKNKIRKQHDKMEKSWFYKKQEAKELERLKVLYEPHIHDANEIMNALFVTYFQDAIPQEFFNRIYATKDVVRLILFAEGGSLLLVLKSFLRSIDSEIQGKK